MKLIKLFSLTLLFILMLGSCAKEDPALNTVGGDAPTVRFTLGGSARKSVTRAATTTPAEENEKAVENVLAVMFDIHDGFYKTVEAREEGDSYGIVVEDDSTYDIFLVANADDVLRTDLENIPAGTSADDPEKGLEAIVAAQPADSESKFLMLSKGSERVTTKITETYSIGEVHMERLAARFDIVNGADGVEVTKVTFNNRTVKSSLQTRNVMPTDADWFKSEEYTPTGLIGNKAAPTEYFHEIYSYENYTDKDGQSIPTLTIEYTEEGKNKTHTVELIDPDAPAMTPLAVKRNHLYRITLTKAYKLEFNLTVADWEAEEEFNVKELPLELGEDQQAELNSRLLVNMFTNYNVKNLNLSTKEVEFFDHLPSSIDEYPTSSYFGWEELYNAGVLSDTETGILHDSEGNQYRIPTVGEILLLMPQNTQLSPYANIFNEYNKQLLYHINWQQVSPMINDSFTEYMFLKNGANNFAYTTNNLTITDVTDSEFYGESYLRRGKTLRVVDYTNDKRIDSSERNVKKLTAVYGVRFKGTSQYAAYKWEFMPDEKYLSIKIKALPQDANVDIDEIVDNHSYWAKGYIEYKIPTETGAINPTEDKMVYTAEGLFWSSSRKDRSRPYYTRFTVWGCYPVYTYNELSYRRQLFNLVRVNDNGNVIE
ncbi:MAG: hypothetical protein K2M56_00780 [Muribaculaceae bacterium]|nr:hypothetical protein [Muribaculaceae bacterium]